MEEYLYELIKDRNYKFSCLKHKIIWKSEPDKDGYYAIYIEDKDKRELRRIFSLDIQTGLSLEHVMDTALSVNTYLYIMGVSPFSASNKAFYSLEDLTTLAEELNDQESIQHKSFHKLCLEQKKWKFEKILKEVNAELEKLA